MPDAEQATPSTPATPPPEFIPAYILRNRGVPIRLYRLTEDGQAPTPPEDDEGDWEPPVRKVHLRFTANHVAEIEDAFDGLRAVVPVVERTVARKGDGEAIEGPAGLVYEEKVVGHEERVFYGLEAFQKALDVKTFSTVRRVIAIGLGSDVEEIGRAMIPEESMAYTNAVGIAWSIAQGVDPTDAAEALRRATAAVVEQRASLASELTSMTVPGSE